MFGVDGQRHLVPRPTAVLWDLDGTLLDSAPTITRALAATLADLGPGSAARYVDDPAALRRFVGPPLRVTLAELLPGVDTEVSVPHYRRLYGRIMGEAPVLPDGVRAVAALRAAGLPMAVATSKQQQAASELVARHGLSEDFVAVCGAGAGDAAGDKASVVARALAALRGAGADLSAPVMVGDRIHDVEGAGAHGVDTILVGWGYGSPEERAAALAVADDAEDLVGLLGS